MTKYTIGLDDTDSGRAAVDWVCALPLGGGDVVKLVTVVEFFGESSRRANARLAEAAQRVRAQHPGAEVLEVYAEGPTVQRLVAEARGGDQLVIGAHRDRILQSMATGWLPERIAIESEVPTVVVPDDWNRIDGDGDVLVGVDTERDAAAALVGAGFAKTFGRSLVLVAARPVPAIAHAGHRHAPAPESAPEAGDVLAAVEHDVHVRFPRLDVVTRTVSEDAEDALVAGAADALVVVLGREHRTAAGGALFGSKALHLIHNSRTALCVVPTK